ncbi:6,7-dimethyl-8-ribityllumazine synthase [Kineococcus xinjiangensis]|uniref:6,7-dimethyl-8-ribityllumazine synthase n=1 Tax=Kineococcus xinjiangensis TaxID=512762 RepID=A0A2S6IP73_9ACTN|nr:6,7-dimethyl-8-ribityllumazine synthase [Kineococcus xinjiangensis]PPK96057.1 6,7-dimethyl-8-ribityllumazine synthase [Kineococcus xinjiangensis]
MSGDGSPDLAVDGTGLKVALVAARWHEEIMGGLLAGAQQGLQDSGVTDVTTVRVPGSFELSVAAARLARTGDYDAVVALGVVIKGGTPHFDYICQAATMGLTEVATSTGVPVGFGVLTVENESQGLHRAGLRGSREDKGREAVLAALETAVALREVAPRTS